MDDIHMSSPLHHSMNSKKRTKRKSKSVKVVYISSPMKVKTSASKFRALVQELTGRESDVARFMESNSGSAMDGSEVSHGQHSIRDDGDHQVPQVCAMNNHRESPTSSEFSYEPTIEDVLGTHTMEQYMGMLSSSSLFGEYSLDVLGSYDEL